MKFVRRQVIDSHEIVAHLDTGGMAEVYLARRTDDGSLSVIKLLREQLKAESELVTMFREEGRLMTRLSHPNVVQVFGHGEADGLPYIAMEYLDGDHLAVFGRAAEKRGWPLTPSLVARVFLQAANGLSYVHEATNEQGKPLGLIHRDISPQNIFMCYDGRIKILDFGIALSADRDVVTRTGMLKGKIRYMSPEQVNAEDLDPRSDIFSLGIVMWELVTGKKLFKDSSEFRTMKKICEEEIPAPATLRPSLPQELDGIIMRCLQRQPAARFPDASALRQALSAFLFSGAHQGRSDELAHMAGEILGGRQQIKLGFIESLSREARMQEYLFGDLGDDLHDTDSELEVPAPASRPMPPPPVGPEVPSPSTKMTPPPASARQPAATYAEAEEPTVESTGADQGDQRPGPRSFPLGGVLVVLLLAGVLAGLVWLAATLLGGGYDTGPAATVANESDAGAGGATGGDAAEAVDAGTAQQAAAGGGDAVQAVAAADITGTDAGQLHPNGERPSTSPIATADAGTERSCDKDPDAAASNAQQADSRGAGENPASQDGPPREPEADDGWPKQHRGMGFLRFDTSPQTRVFLGEEFIGDTPVRDLPLAPGWYTLEVRNEEAHIDKKFRVQIRRHAVTSHRIIY